ncbi:MAG: MraY family glycosyltransferase [Burkholderiales bacterium]
MAPMLLSMARETVLWPLAATVAAMMFGFFLRDARFKPILSALATGAGFLVGYALIYGTFAFPPIEAQGWLPCLIAVNFLVFSFDDLKGFSHKTRMALQGALSIAGAALILLPLFKTGFPALQLAVSALLWFGLWIALDGRNGPVLFLVAAGNAIVSATTGSTLLGQLGGVLAAVLGGHLAFNFPKSRIPLGHAGAAVAVTTLASLMLIGHAYAETALIPSLLLLCAIPADFLGKYLSRNRKGLEMIICGALALVPVAIASTIALKSYLSQEY